MRMQLYSPISILRCRLHLGKPLMQLGVSRCPKRAELVAMNPVPLAHVTSAVSVDEHRPASLIINY